MEQLLEKNKLSNLYNMKQVLSVVPYLPKPMTVFKKTMKTTHHSRNQKKTCSIKYNQMECFNIVCKKNHTPQLNGVYSKNARLVQYSQHN